MDDSSKQVTVIDDHVEVERTIEERPKATVVIYRLKTLESTPRVVHLEEAIPPKDRIRTLEFHPSNLPNEWTIGDGTVEFDVIVPPNETRMVVLGIDAADDEPLGRDEPLISQPDLEMAELRETNGSVPFTRGGTTESPEDGTSVLDLDTETVSDGGDIATESDEEDVLDLADPNADEPDTTAEDSTQSSDSDDDIGVPAEEIGAAPSTDAVEDSIDSADSIDIADTDDSAVDLGLSETDDVDEAAEVETAEDAMNDGDESADDVTGMAVPAGAETADDTGAVDTSTGDPTDKGMAEPPDIAEAEEVPEVDASGEAVDVGEKSDDDLGLDDEPESDDDLGLDDEPEADSAPAADGESLVGDLLAELRAGHASEGELDALRAELGVARADEVRFRHVQSRMDDFEAYVDALEGIINTHGTASEFVDGIEREVTDIHDEISEVRNEVSAVEDGLETADGEREQLTDEVAELDETVAGVSDDLAELRDLVETVDDRTDTLEEELREEIAAVRDERAEQVDRIETELEEMREQLEDDFETELDSLREDVDSFNELRRTLLDAFGDGLEPTSDDDTAVR